ncbi:MAG TPA: hypothetical protein ENK56_09500 [Chloroflexi bacterium]|nr:hypothetical protein [Chloroflexota bacterium]
MGGLVLALGLGLLLALALALGWRRPTLPRPPDWQATFSSDEGWQQGGSVQARCDEDLCLLALPNPAQQGWLVGGPIWRDLEIEVTITPLAGLGSADYGLLLQRTEPPFTTLLFLIGDDGYVSIWRSQGESTADALRSPTHWAPLHPWQEWPHVRRGMTANRLRVRCQEMRCRFFVNDEFTAEVEGEGGKKQVGLFLRTYEWGGLTVRFQTLRVWDLGGDADPASAQSAPGEMRMQGTPTCGDH